LSIATPWTSEGGGTGIPTQPPDWHVSPDVQMLASVHVVPSAAVGLEQRPVPVSQTPATWHWSLAVQTVAIPGEHAPAWQVSPVVHAFASVHVVPFAAAGFEQTPVPVSQTPATWHWSLAVQTVATPGAHTPAWQVSPVVQAFASVHGVPFSIAGFEQRPVPVSQTPAT
jgi:hypothetical protein